jgi:hypothetical protein
MRRLLGFTALLLGIVLVGAAPAGARATDGWGNLTPGGLTPGSYGLFGVTAPGPADAWVVGDVVSRGVQKPLVEHWNGLAWTAAQEQVPLPPHTRSAALDAVSSSSAFNVWAAGSFQTRGSAANLPLLEHYNGTKWKHVVVPADLGMDVILEVATSNRKDLWVFGMNHECTSPDTFLYHWNGAGWKQKRSYSSCSSSGPPPSGPVVQGLFSAGTDTAWALGYTFGGDPSNTPYSTCVGAGCPGPPAGCGGDAFGQLLGGTGSGSDTWLTGWVKDPGTGTQQPLACHWDGSAWSDLSPPADVSTNRSFNATAELPSGQVWAVGSVRPKFTDHNFAMRYTPGQGWQTMAFPSPAGEHLLTTIVHAARTRHMLWAIDDNVAIYHHP